MTDQGILSNSCLTISTEQNWLLASMLVMAKSHPLRTDLLALPPERQKDNEMQGAWMCLLGEEKSMIL